MAESPVTNRKPIIWGCRYWPYRETGMEVARPHPCGGFSVTYHLALTISLKIMWWALLWAVAIGSITTHEDLGAGAVLAFFVIWYFAHESQKYKKAAERIIEDMQRIKLDRDILQSEVRTMRSETNRRVYEDA